CRSRPAFTRRCSRSPPRAPPRARTITTTPRPPAAARPG
ncbi:MAG: hypothetical protein AVDCRST_MAG13-1953, partial [uncultured Solirubrobacteraceae bacterium]